MSNTPNLYIFWTVGGKQSIGEIHADTGRTCQLHTDSDPRLELNPGPWRCEAAVLPTVQPCLWAHPSSSCLTILQYLFSFNSGIQNIPNFNCFTFWQWSLSVYLCVCVYVCASLRLLSVSLCVLHYLSLSAQFQNLLLSPQLLPDLLSISAFTVSESEEW